MKHLKSYENFDKIDEKLGIPGGTSKLKSILTLPITLPLLAITLPLTNMVNGRSIFKLFSNYLDVYNNLDKIVKQIGDIEKANLTDTEKRKAKKLLDEIERIQKRYPTIDDYKRYLTKISKKINYKNKDFLAKNIEEYKPVDKLSLEKLGKILNDFKDSK